MIISPGRRYIFVHIPKTGGTALALALEERALADDILIGDTPTARARAGRLKGLKTAGRLWKHSTLADIDGLVCPEDFGQMLAVTLVRNPWDRIVSLYHWLKLQSFDHPMVARAKNASFPGFLKAPGTAAAIHAAPYASYLRRPSSGQGPDLFIRIEHFANDAAPLEDHLGFTLPVLPRVNASDRPRDWRPFYSAADARLVGLISAEDIARFAYRFDP